MVQDHENGEGPDGRFMNREAARNTLTSGRTCFWSRSRQALWIKGETSGNAQVVKEVYVDCDKDCFVVKVDQTGAACHEGYRDCFFRQVGENGEEKVVAPRLTQDY